MKQQTLDTATVDSHLIEIKSAIKDIYEKNQSHLSFEKLYRYCYQLALSKNGTSFILFFLIMRLKLMFNVGKLLYDEVAKTVKYLHISDVGYFSC